MSVAACRGKARFRTQLDAKLALMRISRMRDDSRQEKRPVRCYRCHCGGWHLTSWPRNRALRAAYLAWTPESLAARGG